MAVTRADDLEQSWIANAANWTRAVREGLIPSRKAGTDAAIVDTIVERKPRRLLDVGCGEGWLIRAIKAKLSCEAVGIDGSPSLIRDAAAADPEGTYLVLRYEELIAGRHQLGGGFDVIVFNYALFEEDIAPLLAAARSLLAPAGAIVIQTLHPGTFAAAKEGWHIEDFSAFAIRDWSPMPWYFRSIASWHDVIAIAGLALTATREPRAQPDDPALSLLLVCETAP